MDYAKFLIKAQPVLTLPYFRGNSVCDDQLTYRVRTELEAGWYQFRKTGRYLEVIARTESELEKWKLPRVLGYVFGQTLVGLDFTCPLYGLPEQTDFALFAPISAFRWFDGHVLFGRAEFDSEVEVEVREAFEEERKIDAIKGVTPALAHVFMLHATQRALAQEKERLAGMERDRAKRQAELDRWQHSIEGRISLALSHTGAELVNWRRVDGNQALVRYRIAGRRFECVIDMASLQIVDAGICLSGADEELNLSSLPSAVQEAINTRQLHVFRHV